MSLNPVDVISGCARNQGSRDWNPISRLTINEALSDSPLFRQNLTRAELIAAHIQAHYQLTLESCRVAMKTGEAFASALFNLARCLDVDLLPKQTCSIADLPSRWSGVSYDACKGLSQVNRSLTHFARQIRQLTAQLTKPERLMEEARSELDHLFELRANFQRASEQLDSAIARSASLGPGRPYSELKQVDGQVAELSVVYRQTAAVYLAGLRAAISSTPLITFLKTNQMLLSAKRVLEEDLDPRRGPLIQLGSPEDSTSNLISFLSKLTNWSETGRRLDCAEGSVANTTVPDEKVINSNTSSLQSGANATSRGLEGYLFKRSGKRTWRSWSRRWFRLRDNQLVYCKRLPDLTASELQSFTEATLNVMRGQLGQSVVTDRDANSARLSFEDLLAHGRPNTVIKPQWKVMEPDLHLCTAREGSAGFERRFTFELISPGNRIHLLQAESFVQKERWVEALRTGLLRLQQQQQQQQHESGKQSNGFLDGLTPRATQSSAISPAVSEDHLAASETTALRVRQQRRSSRSNGTATVVTASQQSIPDYDRLRSQGGIVLWREPDLAGNRQCADCSAEETNWASINLGVTLCTQCAAAHRGLGVHISKIRSLTLDNWEPEQLHVMLNLGNLLVNMIYEAQVRTAGGLNRPTGHSSSEHRRQWARAKWAHCQFARLPTTETESGQSTGDWIRQLYDKWSELRAKQCLSSTGTPNCDPRSSDNAGDERDSNNLSRRRTPGRQSQRRVILDELCQMFDQMQGQQTGNGSRTTSRNTLRSTTLLRADQKRYDQLAARLLSTGARLGCPPLMLLGLVGGAHPDGEQQQFHQSPPYEATGRSGTINRSDWSTQPPLILTIRSGSLAACEFLLLNGADIDVQDSHGRTALFYACQLQRVHLVCLLLRRRADQMRSDRHGRLPLDVAMEMANADIVTLLRLQRLHESNKESDYNLTDDTVADVFRDFTCRAYTHDSSEDLSDYTVLGEPRHSTSSPSLVHIQDTPSSSETPPRRANPSSPLFSPQLAMDSRRRVRPISNKASSSTTNMTASPSPKSSNSSSPVKINQRKSNKVVLVRQDGKK
ncbi:Arf-GAP with coiled-coil ANK repeat and PH domain-containing protein 2 [Fasciolopsis buskii]|uniref:Arf-GAP with coiled-coil ANK repeat and PH domain-containing protein 2 n=1 Tax=Fasciolopsis buskii TaxID=27845 RepID=A0A8E0S4S5_9TREM|nr:Arf-GAP with coiled-coil ANK repeat and PH domain-containing protein 2 [Fasciolopsis buski]